MSTPRWYEVVPYSKDIPISGPLTRPAAIALAKRLVGSSAVIEPVVCDDESGTSDGGTVHVAARVRELSLNDPASTRWEYTIRPMERATQGN